jgi:O-methyltransferase
MDESKKMLAYQSEKEVLNLAKFADLALTVPGNFIEVGVFRGGSATIIEKHLGDKKLYLCDTFSGFKDLGDNDPTDLLGDFENCNIENIKEFVKGKNIEIIEGYFPDSAEELKDEKFAFAHVDVDTYASTLKTLYFIFSRLSAGGFILVHDYLNKNLGVKEAVLDFLKNNTEGYSLSVLCGTSQVCLVKL